MKVSEVIALLQTANPDDEVILSSDSEGNAYQPVSGFAKGFYAADGYYGEYLWEGDKEEIEEYGEDALVKCIVLFP